MRVDRSPAGVRLVQRASRAQHGRLLVGLLLVHAPIRRLARQQAVLPGQVRRLLHARHEGHEEDDAEARLYLVVPGHDRPAQEAAYRRKWK